MNSVYKHNRMKLSASANLASRIKLYAYKLPLELKQNLKEPNQGKKVHRLKFGENEQVEDCVVRVMNIYACTASARSMAPSSNATLSSLSHIDTHV